MRQWIAFANTQRHRERFWIVMTIGLLAPFLILTIILSTGVLSYPTLQVEQLLLHRPLTGLDCGLRTWRRLGTVEYSLFFTLALGIVCLLLRYRWRVLPTLLLLFFIGVGAEYVGKQVFSQPVPDSLNTGMHALICPQLDRQPRSVRLEVLLGQWWKAPPLPQEWAEAEHYGATASFTIEQADPFSSYPSGHAIRWCFLGLVACWLFWRHVKYRMLRFLLMAIALIAAFGGGFAQFYIGVHLITDLIAGYLFGAALACCAIALLIHNEARKKSQGNVPVAQADLFLSHKS